MNSKQYAVFQSKDGGGDVYLGMASTLNEAKRMAKLHANGDLIGLHEWEYETARVAGHVFGVRPPPDSSLIGNPDKWFGEGGWYCACPIKSEE